MITLSTPNGPTVQYASTDIAVAMMDFARTHMTGYLVQAIEDPEAKFACASKQSKSTTNLPPPPPPSPCTEGHRDDTGKTTSSTFTVDVLGTKGAW